MKCWAQLRRCHVLQDDGVRAVPAARELARRLRVDVEALAGSGANGIVTLDDVLAAAPAARATDSPARMPVATSSMRPATSQTETGELEVLRSLRRAMAQSMTLARDNVMECTVFDDADIDSWRQGWRLHRAAAARHRRRLPGRTGTQCLVRWQHPGAAAVPSHPGRHRGGIHRMACWCR